MKRPAALALGLLLTGSVARAQPHPAPVPPGPPAADDQRTPEQLRKEVL